MSHCNPPNDRYQATAPPSLWMGVNQGWVALVLKWSSLLASSAVLFVCQSGPLWSLYASPSQTMSSVPSTAGATSARAGRLPTVHSTNLPSAGEKNNHIWECTGFMSLQIKPSFLLSLTVGTFIHYLGLNFHLVFFVQHPLLLIQRTFLSSL